MSYTTRKTGGSMNLQKALIILAHTLLGWALCGAVMLIGRQMMLLETTLIVHAIAAPMIFALISWFYFTRFAFTTPLQTALIFAGTVILMDVVVIALFVERSFAMFSSLLGTWIPFALIFASTYLTGLFIPTHTEATVKRSAGG